jgi:valyl-tRNA synthetase
MSKSLGTGIDPLDLIDAHGADATRYGLLKMSSTQDVRFTESALEEGRKLANKLWNVARLLLGAAGEDGAVEPELRPSSLEERWILARLERARAAVEEDLKAFRFSAAVATLYRTTFDDFCDWYAEAVKPRLYARDEDAIATALAALERLLQILHPVMPHVTEEIWTALPARRSRLIVAPWPEPWGSDADPEALQRVQDAAAIYRRSGIRVELDGDEARIFDAVVRPTPDGEGDAQAEIARLRKEVERGERMLANERFVANAPADVVDGERAKLERYRRELGALER